MQASAHLGLAFREAANEGNLLKVISLYEEDPAVLDSFGTKTGQSALHRATQKGHVDVVAWLLTKGANIHLEDKTPITCYQLGLTSKNSEINQLYLTAGFARLSLDSHTQPIALNHFLAEDEAKWLILNTKNNLKHRLFESLNIALRYWGRTEFVDGSEAINAFQSLHHRLLAYWEKSDRVACNAERQFLHVLLVSLIVTLQKENNFFASLHEDPLKARCFADICFMHALVSYEKALVGSVSTQSVAAHNQCYTDLAACNSSFKRADAFYISDAASQNEYDLLKKELLQNIYALSCKVDPDYMGFRELQTHVARYNDKAKRRGESYHAKVFFNMTVHTQQVIDVRVLAAVIKDIDKIKQQKQPGTQFIIDVIGSGHALVLDVRFNPKSHKLELICVEPSQMHLQYLFLQALIKTMPSNLGPYDLVAIQGALLKDMSSCRTYSLVLSKAISRLSYEQISKTVTIDQPVFYNGRQAVQFAPLSKVVWKDVTALGQRIIMMGQSISQMEMQLNCMLGKTQNVEAMVQGFLNIYRLPPEVYCPVKLANKDNVQSYVHYRRHSLRQRLRQDLYDDLSIEFVLAKHHAKKPEQALRFQAMGAGPQREMEFLLAKHPEAVNEVVNDKTALDWAYQSQCVKRAKLLQARGGVTAKSLRK